MEDDLLDLTGDLHRRPADAAGRGSDEDAVAGPHPRFLTDLGRTLVEPIEALTNWARDYGGAIVDFQEAAEAAASARARVAG